MTKFLKYVLAYFRAPDRVEVYQDMKGEWRWHKKARNNEIVSDSGEGYKRKYTCKQAAERNNPGCKVQFL